MNRATFWVLQAALVAAVAAVTLGLRYEMTRHQRRVAIASGDRSTKRIGEIRNVGGAVQHKGAEGIEWVAARAGSALRENDRLQTGNGTSIVSLEGRDKVTVDRNSLVVFRAREEAFDDAVEIQSGTADFEGDVLIRSGGTTIRSRPRHVEYLASTGPLPADARARVEAEVEHAQQLVGIAQKLGASPESLASAGLLVGQAGAALQGGDLATARARALEGYLAALGPYRRARATRKALVSVSRAPDGTYRVQVLQGEVTILSPVKTVTLREGEGAAFNSAGAPQKTKKLLRPPVVVHPKQDQVVWNRSRFPFEWAALEGSVEYTIELARDPEFTDVLFSGPVESTTWIPEMELSDGTYHWRVRGKDAESFVGMHARQSFRIATDREPPALEVTLKGAWEEQP